MTDTNRDCLAAAEKFVEMIPDVEKIDRVMLGDDIVYTCRKGKSWTYAYSRGGRTWATSTVHDTVSCRNPIEAFARTDLVRFSNKKEALKWGICWSHYYNRIEV